MSCIVCKLNEATLCSIETPYEQFCNRICAHTFYDGNSRDLHCLLRQLMIEHVDYTHNVIVAIARNLSKEDTNAYIARLLKNQEDIGNAVGGRSSKKFIKLLKEHITQAGDILFAVRDEKNITELTRKWFVNARQISKHLNTIGNKKFSFEEINQAFDTHLNQTLKEATAIFEGNMDKGIEWYDKARNHMLTIATVIFQLVQ